MSYATPQPVVLPGDWTVAAGAMNLQSNLPAFSYPKNLAWCTDRTPNPGYMVSTLVSGVWTWVPNAAAALSNTTPLVESGSGSAGTATDTARSDHVHPAQSIPTIPSAATAAPLAPGTAAVGVSAKYAREDHVHPLQTGSLTLMGTVTVGETVIISLSLGVKRYTGTISGLAVGDKLVAVLTGSPGSSSLQDIYVSATNTYNVGLLNPALGIGAVIAVPIAIFRVS